MTEVGHAAAALADPVRAPFVALIPLLPLAGAIVLGLFGERLQASRGKGLVGALGVSTVAASFVLSLLAGALSLGCGSEPQGSTGGGTDHVDGQVTWNQDVAPIVTSVRP